MYARKVQQKTLTFGVSGMLWNRSLVMYDRETQSLWSHILGLSMRGELKGSELEQIPSVMTDWKTWKKDHPDTTVLWISRTSSEYRREFYRRPEQFVLGIADAGEARAWRFDSLIRTPAVNDSWSDTPVLVAFEPKSLTARLYDRTVDGKTLTFKIMGQGKALVDQETNSTWEPTTGRAVSGPFKGKSMKPFPAIVSYKHVWLKFHPNSK